MSKSEPRWSVLPHDPIEELAENLWSARGELPRIPIGRQMTVARFGDRKLFLHSPMALHEAGMEHLQRLGEIAVIYVPNHTHRMDCASYQQRFPEARLLCPVGARAAVEKVARVDGTIEEWEPRSGLSLTELPGTGRGEAVLRVESEAGDTLVFNDAFFNVPHQPGFRGWIVRKLGSTGGPRVTWLARRVVVKDPAAYRAALEGYAADERIVRLIPGHGDRIEEDVSGVLRAVAQTL